MSSIMDRRQFVKLCGSSVVAASSFFPRVAKAKNTTYSDIRGFNEKQERIIRQALNTAVSRLQEEQIWAKIYAEANLKHFVTNDAMKSSNLPDTDEWRDKLLLQQLQCLSQSNGPNDVEPAFPNILIKAEPGDESWVGHAPLNKVFIYLDGGEFKQKGEFEVTLNSNYVGKDRSYSSVDFWAGTIAHEMLHNLGHQHGDLKSDKNFCNYQIIVLDRVVQSNGSDATCAYGSSSGFVSSSSLPGCRTNSRP